MPGAAPPLPHEPFRAALRVLAELAPAGRSTTLSVSGDGQPFLWYGLQFKASQLFLEEAGSDGSVLAVPSTAPLERLAALDDLNRHERALRAGWLFLCGKVTVGSASRRVLLPLVSRPVRITQQRLAFEDLGFFQSVNELTRDEAIQHKANIEALNKVRGHVVTAAGDTRVCDLVASPAVAIDLESRLADAFPRTPRDAFAATGLFADRRLGDWVRTAVKAAGLPLPDLAPLGTDPRMVNDDDGLQVALGFGLFTARDAVLPGTAGILEEWADREGIDHTAFAELYRPPTEGSLQPHTPRRPSVRSTLALSDEQEAVVDRVRTERIVALSGPPGNGKSHTVAAAALDALARGQTVLIATQTQFAAQVIVDLMARQPGPAPVAFGDLEHRRDLADSLLDGVKGLWHDDPDDRSRHEQAMRDAEAAAEQALLDRLGRDHRFALAYADPARLDQLQRALPSLFRARPTPHDLEDLDDIAGLAAHVEVRGRNTGPFAELRRERAEARLREAVAAPTTLPTDDILDAVRAATALAAVAAVDDRAHTASDVAALATALIDCRTASRHAQGEHLASRMRQRQRDDKKARFVVEQLVTSLRAGRAQRRRALLDLDGDVLLRALPLWVGTLGDIEDLLPPVPGLFDLVVIDEASQVDQASAAPALLRAERAMIVGDPRQLRHVSFVGDADIRAAIAKHDAHVLAARLDARRNSIFDVAAGSSAVVWLSEHFRSVPHLIDFSSKRFYSDRMLLRTRRPTTEHRHAIERVTVEGSRPKSGVNKAEVEAVRTELRRLAEEGVRSIGAVTPFRAQATALEKMVLREFSADEIARLDLRVGTVHAFQGSECDAVVASMVVTAADNPASRRFVDDPNLFNVLVTRARERMVVVTSVTPAPDDTSLLAAYLRHAVEDLPYSEDRQVTDQWVADVAAALERRGVRTRMGFPFASWSLDLCLAGDRDVVLDCRVHPAGAAPHVELLEALLTSGWKVLDAHAASHDGIAALAADRLLARLA